MFLRRAARGIEEDYREGQTFKSALDGCREGVLGTKREWEPWWAPTLCFRWVSLRLHSE